MKQDLSNPTKLYIQNFNLNQVDSIKNLIQYLGLVKKIIHLKHG
jgi:hypothetical protein